MAAPEGRAALRQGDIPALAHSYILKKAGVNMDFDMIMQAISTLGFPIVVCAALFWYVYKKDETHSKEVEALRETIAENTNIIHEVKELIKVLAGK